MGRQPTQADIEHLRYRIEMLEKQNEILAEVRDCVVAMKEQLRLLNENKCPSPGRCLDLEKSVETNAADIKRINLTLAWVKGAWWGVATVAAAVSTVVTFGIARLIDYFKP